MEYDCTESTAMERIAVQGDKIAVKWRTGDDTYTYGKVPEYIVELLSTNESKGRLVAQIKKLRRFKRIRTFPATNLNPEPVTAEGSTAGSRRSGSRGPPVVASDDEGDEGTPYTEYDCSDSTAVERMAISGSKIAVLWKTGPETCIYGKVPPFLTELVQKGESKGKLVAQIKKLRRFKKVKNFPKAEGEIQCPVGPAEEEEAA